MKRWSFKVIKAVHGGPVLKASCLFYFIPPIAAIFVHVPMGTPFMCVMHLIVMTENEENEN